MPPNLQKLQELMKIANEGLTRKEFVSAFKEVLKVVKDIKDNNASEWKLIHEAMKKIPDKMMSEMMSSMSATEKKMVKDCMDKCEKMCAEMDKKHAQEMAKMSLDVKMIQADREAIIEDALAKVPPQIMETPEQVRDKIETLPDGEKLSIQAIQDLSKMLEEIKRVASRPVSGGLISKRIRFVDDETPTGAVNGSNTAFTITRAPETGSLKVYVNGQRQRVTTDYTFSHKTITFITAPPTGSILLVDFRY